MKCLGMMIIIVLTAISATSAHAGREIVGIFLKSEKDDCTLIRIKQSYPCVQGIKLIPDDVIVTSRPIESLKIQWIQDRPPTKKETANCYRVVNEIREKSSLISLIFDIPDFNRKASHVIAAIHTRGNDEYTEMLGDNATLIPGFQVTFSRFVGTTRRLVIEDSAGNVVKKSSSLVVTPEMMGLKKGNSYNWKIENTNFHGTNLKLLDDDSIKVVMEAFEKIEANNALGTNDKVIAKASFVLFMSESYPKEVSLNWLSYQLIDQRESAFLDADKKVAEYLKMRSNFKPAGM